MITPERRYEIWSERIQSTIAMLQMKYCNRVYSRSDIRQECLLKLFLVAGKIKPGMHERQIRKFLRVCLERHIIDKAVKFISPEGHSKGFHKKLREERPYQFADKGTHVGVRHIDGQSSMGTARENELLLDFMDELEFQCTNTEIAYIQERMFNGHTNDQITENLGISREFFKGMNKRVSEKIHRAMEDAR